MSSCNSPTSSNSEDSGFGNRLAEDSISTSSKSSNYNHPIIASATSLKSRICCMETYNISGHSIEIISSQTFQYYASYVKHLDLSKNKISYLPESICELRNLQVLNLSYNNFVTIPDSWKVMYHLKVFNLSNNQLREGPKCLELGMPRLTYLNLSHNKITYLNAPVCVYFLQELNLSDNLLETLPLWLFSDKCRSLIELDVSANLCFDDTTLANNLYLSKHFRTSSLKTLEKLNISNTRSNLSMISCVSNFESLQTLYMGNNVRISSKRNFNSFLDLPLTVFTNPVNITELYIPNVGLASVPDEVYKLENLQMLDISENPLGWLPESFGQLTHLQELIMSNCNLTYLPDSFGQLTSLTKLIMGDNKVSAVSLYYTLCYYFMSVLVYNTVIYYICINTFITLHPSNMCTTSNMHYEDFLTLLFFF